MYYFGISLNILHICRIIYISCPVHVNAVVMFQPILSSSKHINKSTDYSYLHPWLGTGLLTSAGEIIFLNSFIYSVSLRTIQFTLWGLVEMTKKCCESALTPSVFEIRFDINVRLLADTTFTDLFFISVC